MFEYKVREVLEVVDGDTLDVEIDLGFAIFIKQRVRLAGIDTPESRTTDLNEKKFGLEAKQFLKDQLDKCKNITIVTEKPDNKEKYGRFLAWLFLDDSAISLNNLMVSKGYAWKYDGGTKTKDFDALLKLRK